MQDGIHLFACPSQHTGFADSTTAALFCFVFVSLCVCLLLRIFQRDVMQSVQYPEDCCALFKAIIELDNASAHVLILN